MLKKSLVVFTVLLAFLIIPSSSFAGSGKLQKVKTSCTVSPEGALADVYFQATMLGKYNRGNFNIKKVNYFYNIEPKKVYLLNQQGAKFNKWMGSFSLNRKNLKIKDKRRKAGLVVGEASSFRTNWKAPVWQRDTQVFFSIEWKSLTKEAIPYQLPPVVSCQANFPFKQIKK